MKGLLLYKLYLLRRPVTLFYWLFGALFGIGMALLSLLGGNNARGDYWMMAFILALMLLVMTHFATSVNAGIPWDRYCRITPAGDDGWINADYIFCLLTIVLAGLVSSAGPLTDMLLYQEWSAAPFCFGISVIVSVLTVISALVMPVALRFGVVGKTICGAVLGLGFFVYTLLDGEQNRLMLWLTEWLQGKNLWLLSAGSLAAAAVMLTLSWLLAGALYKRKEL